MLILQFLSLHQLLRLSSGLFGNGTLPSNSKTPLGPSAVLDMVLGGKKTKRIAFKPIILSTTVFPSLTEIKDEQVFLHKVRL